MEQSTELYLESLLVEHKKKWILDLKKQALDSNIPIMESTGIEFLLQMLRLRQPKKILEIGAAIGYSALRMEAVCPNSKVLTIEKDEIRYNQAIQNISKYKKQDKIEVKLGDAHIIMQTLRENNEKYDCIFIDAAKGQYEKFFSAADLLLKNNGVIITDNVLFRGYVKGHEHIPKKYINMVKKLRNYNNMLMSHESYTTNIIPVGDGVAISIKK